MAKFFLLLIIIFHSILLTKLFFFPYPELFIYPYLTNHGLLPYKQIIDQHFPGLMFLPINFDNLGMTNPDIARIWLIVTVVITQVLLFVISKEILKSSKKALLVNILYLIWQPFFEGWVLWIDNFLPLFLLPTFYFSIKRKLFLTGLFLGVAIIFKQTIIPLSVLFLIYLFLDGKNLKEVLLYLVGLFIPIFLMILYIFGIGVIGDFWYWNIIFNLTTYASYGTKTAIEAGFISRILFVYSISLTAFTAKEKRIVYILFIFLCGSLISILDRADFIHLQPSLPFVVLATSLGLFSIKNKRSLLIFILIYFSITLWWQIVFYKGHLGSKIFLFDNQTYDLSNKIKLLSKSGDKIFLYGTSPILYTMTQTLPAGDIFVFQFPWFLKVSQDRILDGIKKDQPKIIVFDTSYKVEGQELKAFSEKIYQYIESHYKKIDNINTVEILQRKD